MLNLQKVVEKIADERSIEEERIEDIIEDAYIKAAGERFGEGYDFEAEYDKVNNEMELRNCYVAKDEPESQRRHVSKEYGDLQEGDELVFEVHRKDPEKQRTLQRRYGDWIDIPEPLEGDFDRIAINRARDYLSREIRQVNRERAHKLYKDQIGNIVSGRVRYISKYNIAVDLGKTKAILPIDYTMPNEGFDEGDRVTAVVKKVNDPSEDEQIILSRTDPSFVAALFEEDVEEVREGRIEIKDIVRNAGYKTKMSTVANERGLSAVGPCIGRNGETVMNISNKLGGERIDIIPYTTNLETYAENALGQELDILFSEEKENRIKIKIPDEQMDRAIGKNGKNVQLASELVGKKIVLESMNIEE